MLKHLINLIVRGLYRLPTAPAGATGIQTSDTPEVRANMGRVVIYCNPIIRTYLDLQAMNKTNVLLRLEEYNGKVNLKNIYVPSEGSGLKSVVVTASPFAAASDEEGVPF